MWLIKSLNLQDDDSEEGSIEYLYKSYNNVIKTYNKKHIFLIGKTIKKRKI